MHPDELHTDAELVRRLLAMQFPQWAALPIERVPSTGTDNALYRLGSDLVARLPRIEWAAGGVAKDCEWLPKLAPLLPVEIPVPLAKGEPAEGYPWEWGVYPWLEGANPVGGRIEDPEALARQIAEFAETLQSVELEDAPRASRGVPLSSRDEPVYAAIAALEGMIDTDAAAAQWEEARATPEWPRAPVWIHGDLLGGNLLLQSARLTGVIDWSGAGLGDPATDLIVAWGVLPRGTREWYRDRLGVDDHTWVRGRGWALSVGLIALPYYKDTNPGFAATARVLIEQVLAG